MYGEVGEAAMQNDYQQSSVLPPLLPSVMLFHQTFSLSQPPFPWVFRLAPLPLSCIILFLEGLPSSGKDLIQISSSRKVHSKL